MELHLLRQGLPIFPDLWPPIFSQQHNCFQECQAPLPAPSYLKQLVHPAAIGERKHGECCAVENPPIHTLKLKDEFIAPFKRLAKPVISQAQYLWTITK